MTRLVGMASGLELEDDDDEEELEDEDDDDEEELDELEDEEELDDAGFGGCRCSAPMR